MNHALSITLAASRGATPTDLGLPVDPTTASTLNGNAKIGVRRGPRPLALHLVIGIDGHSQGAAVVPQVLPADRRQGRGPAPRWFMGAGFIALLLALALKYLFKAKRAKHKQAKKRGPK